MSRSDVLVSADWAQQNIGAPGIVFVEVDEDTSAYDGGHLEGAVKLDWKKDLQDPVSRPATQYTAQDPDLSIRAFRDEVVASIGSKNIIDVRSPDEFSGKILAPAHLPQEMAQKGGHVPTAKNIPWSKAANEDGTFKSKEELQKLFAEIGIDGKSPIITYCRIGERSSHTWFVLRELLGKPDVKNYDGSWVEYGSLVGVPIEK